MAYALAIVIIWLVLFGPPGLLLQRIVLGRTASSSFDLVLAPVTGLAAAVAVLSMLATFHVRAGAMAVQVAAVIIAVLSGALLRRMRAPIRGSHLAWALVALVVTAVVIQIPVWSHAGDGPLAYTTQHEPVLQTAEIRFAADGSGSAAARTPIDHAARTALRHGYPGFAQLAGFTVGLGASQDAGWSAFGLDGLLTAMLAAFTVLPVFVLARSRGLRWLPTAIACVVGALSPLVLLGVGLAEGPGIAALPFSVAAVVLALRADTDRGRWALVALCAAAVLCTLGPLGLIPLAAVLVARLAARRIALPESDRPVDPPLLAAPRIVLAAASAAGVVGVIGAGDGLIHGRGLPWSVLFRGVGGSVRAWPLAWIGSSLEAHAVTGITELVGAGLGVLLVLLAGVVAVRRRARVDAAIVLGGVLTVLVGLIAALVHRATGQQVLEQGLLASSPLLAVVCVRAVVVLRGPAVVGVPTPPTARRRIQVQAIEAVGIVFVVLAVAASLTSGSRMTHTPAAEELDHASSTAVTLDASRWVAYTLPSRSASLARHAVTDVDALTGPAVPASERLDGVHARRVVTDESPFASDPPSIYEPDGSLFGDPVWDSYRSVPDRTTQLALRHDPVEDAATVGHGPEAAGGLLTPPILGSCNGIVRTCVDDIPTAGTCPDASPSVSIPLSLQPTVPKTDSFVAAVAKHPDGLACWTVPLDPDASYLLVHVRQVGYVLDASDAHPRSGTWHHTTLDGQPAWTTTHRGATLSFSVPGLAGCLNAQFDARTSAGALLVPGGPTIVETGACTDANPSIPSTGDQIVGSARTWTEAAQTGTLHGDFGVRDSSGTRVSVAAATVTDPKAPEACDAVLPLTGTAHATDPAGTVRVAGKGEIFTPGTSGSFEVQVVAISGSGADQTATVVLRSFGDAAQGAGVPEPVGHASPPPFHFLADWTEQFRSDPSSQVDASATSGSSDSCTTTTSGTSGPSGLSGASGASGTTTTSAGAPSAGE